MMGGMGSSVVLWIVGFAILVAFLGFMWRASSRTNRPRPADAVGAGGTADQNAALQLLRHRYASGEIEDEEFYRRQSNLV